MDTTQHVLFIQGGGAGVHDDWDTRLVDDLQRRLGNGYDVRYPRMPDEHDPGYPAWSAAIRHELSTLAAPAIVVGHSVGGTVLINTLAEYRPEPPLRGIVLLSAPFVGDGGWPAEGFAPAPDLGSRLAAGVPVHVFQGTHDQTTPLSHAGLYAAAIPDAVVHRLRGRDHQLGDDMTEVAQTVKSLRHRRDPQT